MNQTADLANAVTTLRKFLRAIVALGLIGSGTELWLLGHTEDWRQWVPLGLIAASLAALAWHCASPDARNTRLFAALMALCVIAGGAGIYFHLLGSMEFKLESRPTLAGMELFWEALRSKAPPLLAPGSMIQLGLLGLVYTYKHPARQRAER